MTGRVDVLAVMDEFIGCASLSSARPPLRMSDARAAVAELVAAARLIDAEVRRERDGNDDLYGHIEAMQKALARIGSAP